MNIPFYSLHASKSIVASVMTPSKLIFIDTTPTIYTYSHQGLYEKHSSFKGFKSYIHRYTTAITTSKDGMYALICDFEYDRVLLFHLQKSSLASQIKYDKTPDYCLFSDDSSHFALVNSVGRMSLYETKFSSIVTELQLSDAIAAMTFSKDTTLIAIGTLDKKVHIYNIKKQCIQSSFQLNEIVEAISFSKDMATLVVYTRNGNTQLIKHLLNKITLADPLSEWPSTIYHPDNRDISIVGTRSNQLFIYTNTYGNNLGSITFEYWGITSISIINEKIFLAFSDGNGIILDIASYIADALQVLETKNYAQLCSIILECPLILISKNLSERIKADYVDIFRFEAITYEEKQGHNALSSYILSSSQNRSEMLQSLYTSQEILPFMQHINQGEIAQACANAYNTPILRQLREFNDIRSNCLHELKVELKLLEANPQKFKEHVASIPIKCSECIQGIIPEADIIEESYKQLLSSVNAKNFTAVMDLVKKFPILRQTLAYRRLINNGEALIDKTLIMIAAGKMAEAEKYAAMLTRMKPFALTGTDFKTQIRAYETFTQACQKNDIGKVFGMIEEHPVLRTTDLFKEQVQNYHNTILTPALGFAKQGEVVKMQTIITPYIHIEYFSDKHLELLKIALAREIAYYAPLEQEQTLLNRYHDCFGWNEYYQQACEALECTPNTLRKLDEVTQECREIVTFLTDERIKRVTTKKEIPNESK
jgi:hypothetical protein